MKTAVQKTFFILLKLLVTLGSCYYLISKFGNQFKAINFSLSKINFSFLFFAITIFVFLQFLSILRWRYCCEALNINQTWTESIKQYFAGLFANNFLPGAVGGDIVRAYLLKQQSPELGYSNCVASVTIDRAYGLFALSLIGFVSSLIIPEASIHLKTSLGILSLICGGGLFIFSFLKHLPLPGFIPETLKFKIANFLECLSLVQHNFKAVAGLAWTSLFIQVSVTFCLFSVAWALSLNTQTKFLWLINPLATWGSLIAPSINGLGVREGIYAHTFEMFGGKGADGILLSLFWLGLVLFVSLPGAYFLFNGKSKLAKINELEASIECEEEKALAPH